MRALNVVAPPPALTRPCGWAVRCHPAPGAPFLFPPLGAAVFPDACLHNAMRSTRLVQAPSSTSSLRRVKLIVVMGRPVPAVGAANG